MRYAINDLDKVVHELGDSDKQFAQSLITKGARYPLSEKQAFWVDKLTQRAKGEEKTAEVQVGDLTATIALFDKARTHLKNPKVLLAVGTQSVRLSVAGERARVPGSINVASVARFGEGAWYGRISRDGQFQPTPAAANVPGLTEALTAFAADPAKVAAEYGRLTGNCCFCHLPLRDERSTAVGYGPTCADHYGLPWGNKEKNDGNSQAA